MTTHLEQFRAAKDEFFRTSGDSPFSEEQRRTFRGLSYFPDNPSYTFVVDPQELDEPGLVELPTSTGGLARYERWAKVRLSIDAHPVEFTIFRDPGNGSLFLPFQDGLRGRETYGAGRYLEPELRPDGRVLIDFNYAYNPYCAYSDEWSCPLPPAENRTDVPIPAGERIYDHATA